MRVASILLGVALDEGLVTVNLANGLKLPGAEGREQVWPDEAIEAFCATADPNRPALDGPRRPDGR